MLRIVLLVTFVSVVSSLGPPDYDVLGAPYTVAIKTPSAVYSGAIIRPLFVATTASCVDGRKPADLQVRVGTNMYDVGEKHEISKIFVHDQYNKKTLDNDISLLLLKKAFRYVDEIHQVFIARVPPTDLDVHKLTGFGSPKNSNYIKMGIINTRTTDECKVVTNYSENKFCGLPDNTNLEDGSCMAEIGAPAVTSIGGRLSGIISSRDGCQGNVFFTSIAMVSPWIQGIFDKYGN